MNPVVPGQGGGGVGGCGGPQVLRPQTEGTALQPLIGRGAPGGGVQAVCRNGHRASPVVPKVKSRRAMQEKWVRSLGREDPLEKGMATHSCSGLENAVDRGA